MDFFKKKIYMILGSAFAIIVVGSLFWVLYFIVNVLDIVVKTNIDESQFMIDFDSSGYDNIKFFVEKNSADNASKSIKVATTTVSLNKADLKELFRFD